MRASSRSLLLKINLTLLIIAVPFLAFFYVRGYALTRRVATPEVRQRFAKIGNLS